MARLAQTLTLVLLALSIIASCGGGGGAGPVTPAPPALYTYTTPDSTGDGWEVAHLADVGIDEARIVEMMELVQSQFFEGIDSVVIVRNNKLVLYELFDQFGGELDDQTDGLHRMFSTSKSFTSALIGIAIDQGSIASTEVPFYGLFNYGAYENWDPRKAEMTLADVLTMRLGLEWDEWALSYSDPNNQLKLLEDQNDDWVKALLDLPMTSDPGSTYAYNTAGSLALGKVLENVTGIPMAIFAEQHLFQPMNITSATWDRTPTGLPNGGYGLSLTPRDMAKFGQLFIDDGVWQGQQLISPAWIADSVQRRVDVSAWAFFSVAYGFQWWLDDFDHNGGTVAAYETSGHGGQYIFAFPELELVVAFTGRNYENGPGVQNLFIMLEDYVLDAIE